MAVFDALFPSLGLARFLLEVFPEGVWAENGPLNRLEAWSDGVIDPESPEELLARSGASAVAYRLDSGGVVRQIGVSGEEALALYRDGSTVTLEFRGPASSGLESLNLHMAAELGLPFATPPAVTLAPRGGQVPLHFDGVELVALQLRGTKRWWVSHRPGFAHADFPYFESEAGPGARGGSRPSHRPAEVLPPPPSEFDEYELYSGSVLFVPRGHWHRTESLDDSVSVVFRIRTPTAAELVARSVEVRLRRLSDWRRPILGVAGNPGVRALARRELGWLLPRLAADLDLEVASSPEAVLRPWTGVSVAVREGTQLEFKGDGAAERYRVWRDGTPGSWQPVDHQEGAFLRWLVGREGPLTERDLLVVGVELGPAALARLAARLVEEGYLMLDGAPELLPFVPPHDVAPPVRGTTDG